MAIRSLTYANTIVYKDKQGRETGSALQYRQAGTGYIKVYAYKKFAMQPTNTRQRIRLIEYNNGNYVEIDYTLIPNQYLTQYILDAHIALYNSAGTVVKDGGSGSKTISTDPDNPQYIIPFSECFYASSIVMYDDYNNNTVVGDPARYAEVLGKIYYKQTLKPLTGYVEFDGTHEYGEFNPSYDLLSFLGISQSNDNALNQYFGDVDSAGDGNPWRQTGPMPTPGPIPSGPGGGDDPSDDEGEPVDFPPLPTTSVIATGFITLYNPDNSLLRQLATKMWGNDFEQTIKKILNDPFDGIIGLSMVPFQPTVAGTENCMIGNYDSEIAMPLISQQFMMLDCGMIQVTENWGNALDYNATSAELYVPFVGFRTLDIQDVMNRTLALKYYVDVLSGSGVAMLKCGNKVLYSWPCNMSYDIPLTGSNKQAFYTGMINVALTGAGGVAAGGAMGGVMGAATSAINVATHSQSDVQRSGSIVSNTAMLGEFVPYIVLHRPRQSLALNFKTYKGYQSNITMMLKDCAGYTEVDFIHLEGIKATDTELQEIENLLKSGVII